MFITIDISEFDINYIFYQEKVKNTVMDNSNFSRILYSNSLFTINGIFIKFSVSLTNIEKIYNKYKCSFDSKNIDNYNVTSKIKLIENHILRTCNYTNKTPIYRITEQLNNNYLKVFNDKTHKENNDFILKIYGIWDTDHEYGVTYKFIAL